MTLHPHEAISYFDALEILNIRNICRDGFSEYNERITGAQQQKWWEETDGKRLAWLYRDDTSKSYVAFGVLLLQDDGFWTTTVGVLPESAGKGYGKAITHDLVERAPGPCRAAARKDNPAAVRCHNITEDWDIVEGPDERLVYFRTKAGVTACP